MVVDCGVRGELAPFLRRIRAMPWACLLLAGSVGDACAFEGLEKVTMPTNRVTREQVLEASKGKLQKQWAT